MHIDNHRGLQPVVATLEIPAPYYDLLNQVILIFLLPLPVNSIARGLVYIPTHLIPAGKP